MRLGNIGCLIVTRTAAKPTQITPKPQNRPSPKAEGSANGSTNGDEAAVLKGRKVTRATSQKRKAMRKEEGSELITY